MFGTRNCVFCIAIYLFIVLFGVCNGTFGYVTWKKGPEVVLTDDEDDLPKEYVAKGVYSNEINSTGWAFLELHSSPHSPDEKQAFAVGFLEGYLSRDLVWMHWVNMLKGYCYNKTDVCNKIEQFLDANEEYISGMVKSYPDDPYWYQIHLYFVQLEGVAIGYNEATLDETEKLTVRDILWINMLGDLDELSFALSQPPEQRPLFAEHCTGLVKLLPDHSDLYTSQVTWNSYQSMLRMQKMYVLYYSMSANNSALIPGFKMSMSSYPAFVQSTDDFYIISSGLVPAETTIGNSNRTLFRLVRPRGQVLEYARVMVANRLATSGDQWADIFVRHNSGTYNNQWYIVDYKRFRPASAGSPALLEPGLLWVVEQLPGTTEAKDLTEVLKQTSYFPSYNIAYFPRMFNLSGGQHRVRLLGDWFGYHTNPRAKILKLKQAEVKDLRSMFYVLRYNDFKHDPLSRCPSCQPPYSACNAIAARNDLNPANGSYPFRALGHRSHGATDAKLTSSAMARAYRFIAVAGPPYNISRGVPPFQWSKFDLGAQVSHMGHPDLWMFRPLRHTWKWG